MKIKNNFTAAFHQALCATLHALCSMPSALRPPRKILLHLFAAFITITPVFSQVSDSTKTPPDSVWQELPDQRTYFSKTYYNAHDETFRAEISAGYVHFQTHEGSYQEIDTRLQPVGGNAYEMRDGLYQVRFAGALGQQGGYDVDYELPKPVHGKFKDPGKPTQPTQLRWKIHSLGYFDQKTQRYHVIQKSNPITPAAAGNAISYPQIFNGIDLNYTCGNTRLKEELVLSQSGRNALPDPSKFGVSRTDAYLMLETEFALTPANLQVFARAGNGRVSIKQGNNFAFNGVDRIDFEDADSTLHFFFPEDNAYALADSANRINVTRVFSSQRGKDYVLVGVPFSWVDTAPKGTLIIDPTTTVATSEDVWLENTSNFDAHSAGLLVGKVAGGSKKRTIIKFNIAGSGIPASATVLNAQMKMYYYGTGGSVWVDRWLQAHQILVNWAEAQATSVNRLTGTAWNVAHVGLNDIDAKSSYESTLLFYLNGGQQVYGWKSWDLTNLTQKWVSGTATNYGVVLWATNETTDGKDLRFYSSEAAAPNDVNRPYLNVIYSQQAKTVYFLKDHLGSVRATVQDTVGAPVRGYDDYDPWGYILAGRSLASSILPTTTRNKFTEKEWDDEFGLNWNYFGARYYDPQIGRWMVRDPILNDMRLKIVKKLLQENYFSLSSYHYARNNPTNRIDNSGRFDTKFHIKLTGQAFQEKGYSRDAGGAAAKGNAYVDRVANFFNNNQHGMKNSNQSREQAMAANQKFISTTVEKAVIAAGKDPGKALALLGQAQHTQQDIVRHDYFSMKDHILADGGKNIELDKNPPASELEAAQEGSEQLLTQFEEAVRERYGDDAEEILSTLKNYKLPDQDKKKDDN